MELTDLETKILKAVHGHGNRRLSVEEIADSVGCRPDTVYKRLQKDEFRQMFFEATKNSLSADVPVILNAFVDAAKNGSYKHGQLILEMAGAYDSTQKVQAEISSVEESPFKDDKDKKEFLKKTLEKINASNPPEEGDE